MVKGIETNWKIVVLSLLVILSVSINGCKLTGETIINEESQEQEITEVIQEVTDTDEFSHNINPHWDHMPLTYTIKNCEKPKDAIIWHDYIKDTQRAFNTIENETEGYVSFKEVNDDADITVTCWIGTEILGETSYNEWGWETGRTYVIAVTYPIIEGNIITHADIELYEPQTCPNNSPTQIHEIAHALGLDHSSVGDVTNIMSPYSYTCNSEFNSLTIDMLKLMYNHK